MSVSLTVSTIDTLVNAISSLVVVDGKNFYGDHKKRDFLLLSKIFIVILSIISLIIASKGFSILYLFLLADLLCCAAVFTVFYGFYQKNFNEKNAMISILIGLFLGLLLFPNPDFSKSIFSGHTDTIQFISSDNIWFFIILVIFDSNTWPRNCYNEL